MATDVSSKRVQGAVARSADIQRRSLAARLSSGQYTLALRPLHAVLVEPMPDPQVAERASRRSYTTKYKAVLAEYEGLDRDGKGPLLRRERL
jgi:hypothetical protein